MNNTTFFPDSRIETLNPQMELGLKPEGPQGKIIKGTQPFPRPAKDALGGAGLYSTADDFGLVIKALVSGGAPLLKKESLDTMFKGTVSNRKALMEQAQGSLRQYMSANLPEDLQLDYSLVGSVSLSPIPGRRAEGSVQWAGMSNPMWWVDMKTGVAGAVFTQLLPPGDQTIADLFIALEQQTYKSLSKASL
jgi:CubicO group peptidase (beta-lactamase class C family)